MNKYDPTIAVEIITACLYSLQARIMPMRVRTTQVIQYAVKPPVLYNKIRYSIAPTVHPAQPPRTDTPILIVAANKHPIKQLKITEIDMTVQNTYSLKLFYKNIA